MINGFCLIAVLSYPPLFEKCDDEVCVKAVKNSIIWNMIHSEAYWHKMTDGRSCYAIGPVSPPGWLLIDPTTGRLSHEVPAE